jgi:hypothetical protein
MSSMPRRTPRYPNKERHRWFLFVTLLFLFSIAFFLLGIDRRELWIAVVVLYYMAWVTRMD